MKAIRWGVISAAGLAACAGGGGPEAGEDPMLSVVGNRQILLGSGWEHELEVRYHDEKGNALAGSVQFRLEKGREGASVGTAEVATNEDGIARTTLFAGRRDAEFTLYADAPGVEPATWEVEVSATQPPLELGGEYVIESELSPMDSIPAPVRDAVGIFEAMAEGERAPATWVIDTIVADLESESLRRAVEEFRPELDEAVDGAIRETSPELAADFREIAARLDEAARSVGTTTLLQIGGDVEPGIQRTGPVARHKLTGMSFRVHGGEHHFATGVKTAGLGASEVRVDTLSHESVEVGEHELPLTYGSMLVAALEEVILPAVDSPRTTDTDTFFRRNIDCRRIGEIMAKRVGDGSSSLYESMCEGGTETVAARVVEELYALDEDEGLTLELEGEGHPHDLDDNRVVDRILGSWSGSIRHGGGRVSLDGEESRFRAKRVELR